MSNPGVYVPGVYVPGQQQEQQKQQQQTNYSNPTTQQTGSPQVFVPGIFVPPAQQQPATYSSGYSAQPSVYSSYTQPYAATQPPSWASASAPPQHYSPPPDPALTANQQLPFAHSKPQTTSQQQQQQASNLSPTYSQARVDPTNRPAHATTANKPGQVTDEDMRVEFNMIDVDKSGFIDSADFKKVFGSLISKALIDKAIAMVDKNKDKKISFDEYKVMRAQFGPVKIPKFK
jgi:hypothetical protein